jgi:hypothetical protein
VISGFKKSTKKDDLSEGKSRLTRHAGLAELAGGEEEEDTK